MINRKTILTLIIMVALISGAVILFYSLHSSPKIKTYVKEDGTMKSYKTSEDEIKVIGLQTASFSDPKEEVTIGTGEIDEYKNTPSKEWKNNLGIKLLRFQKPGTKVVITEKRRIIEKKRGIAHHLEEVAISFINTNGRINGFSAIIDGETGEIIKTWGKTIHEKQHGGRITIPKEGYRYPED